MKKIAIPVTISNEIDNHFGHCAYFGIYTIAEGQEITDVKLIKSSSGCGCKSGIAQDLADDGVKLLLAGGIGAGAINVLKSTGIQVIRGCSGNPEKAVRDYLAGYLLDTNITCNHSACNH
jgi:predicted Fe-Mo cluster-binding NifX family protein